MAALAATRTSVPSGTCWRSLLINLERVVDQPDEFPTSTSAQSAVPGLQEPGTAKPPSRAWARCSPASTETGAVLNRPGQPWKEHGCCPLTVGVMPRGRVRRCVGI